MTSWVIDFVQLGQGHQHQGFWIEDGTILNFYRRLRSDMSILSYRSTLLFYSWGTFLVLQGETDIFKTLVDSVSFFSQNLSLLYEASQTAKYLLSSYRMTSTRFVKKSLGLHLCNFRDGDCFICDKTPSFLKRAWKTPSAGSCSTSFCHS